MPYVSPLSFPQDPFAPSEGSAEAAPELDLFAMKPPETSVPVVTPTASTAPPVPATTPSPAPAVAAAAAATTAATTAAAATTATTSAATTTAPPALDIFGGNFFFVIVVELFPPGGLNSGPCDVLHPHLCLHGDCVIKWFSSNHLQLVSEPSRVLMHNWKVMLFQAGLSSWVKACVFLVLDLFESAPDVAPAPKPDAAPSIDLFGTGKANSRLPLH